MDPQTQQYRGTRSHDMELRVGILLRLSKSTSYAFAFNVALELWVYLVLVSAQRTKPTLSIRGATAHFSHY